MNKRTVVFSLSEPSTGGPTFEAQFIVDDIVSFDDFKLTLRNGRTVYPTLTKAEIAHKLELTEASSGPE